MIKEKQIETLAKLDGWLKDADNEGNYFYKEYIIPNGTIREYDVPLYLESYNAILPLIQKQPPAIKELIAVNLWSILKIDSDFSEQEAWSLNFGTAPDEYCEALLRATNNWTD